MPASHLSCSSPFLSDINTHTVVIWLTFGSEMWVFYIKKKGEKDFWLFHLLLQLIHAEIFTSAFYLFLFKTEKLMEKRTQPFDNRIKTQGLRSIQGRMERSAPFKAKPAECASTRRSLGAVRNAFMLLQTWRWDNEFIFQRLRLKPHSLPPLWYQKKSACFHHLPPLVADLRTLLTAPHPH